MPWPTVDTNKLLPKKVKEAQLLKEHFSVPIAPNVLCAGEGRVRVSVFRSGTLLHCWGIPNKNSGGQQTVKYICQKEESGAEKGI